MKYIIKRTLFTGTETFTLEENRLHITSTKKNKSAIFIPYSAFKKVNLIYVPSYKNTPELYQCTLKTNNHKTVKISNNHYEGFGNINPKNKEYSNFILALHQKLTPFKNIVFEKGTSGSKFKTYTIILGTLLLGLLIIGVFGIIKKEYNVGISLLIGALIFGAFFYQLFKSYKPEKYNLKEIPQTVIPFSIKQIL